METRTSVSLWIYQPEHRCYVRPEYHEPSNWELSIKQTFVNFVNEIERGNFVNETLSGYAASMLMSPNITADAIRYLLLPLMDATDNEPITYPLTSYLYVVHRGVQSRNCPEDVLARACLTSPAREIVLTAIKREACPETAQTIGFLRAENLPFAYGI